MSERKKRGGDNVIEIELNIYAVRVRYTGIGKLLRENEPRY